jgi:cytochrome c biogenesis protein CcdA
LVPLALKVNSTAALPAIYGIGTALPVMVFAVLLATSAQSVGKAYNVLAKIEWWARMLTGAVFILVGIYFALKYVFQVL